MSLLIKIISDVRCRIMAKFSAKHIITVLSAIYLPKPVRIAISNVNLDPNKSHLHKAARILFFKKQTNKYKFSQKSGG